MKIYIDCSTKKITKVEQSPIYFGNNNVDKITLVFTDNVLIENDWYPTLSAIGADKVPIYPRGYDTDGEKIYGGRVEYEFTLSTFNGWNLTPGKTLFYIWINYSDTNGNECIGSFACTILASSGYYKIDNFVVNPDLREYLDYTFERHYNEVDVKLEEMSQELSNSFSELKEDFIDEYSEEINTQRGLINNLVGGEPRYVGNTDNIRTLTSNHGIAVNTDNGHWYYWDGEKYVDSNQPYQATAISYNDMLNFMTLVDYDRTAQKYNLKRSLKFNWEMGLLDHDDKLNSTFRCRSVNYLDLENGKCVVHLLDSSVRFYIYEYKNDSFVQTWGWKTTDFEFTARVGYKYKIVASFVPESKISNITDVTDKIAVYTSVDYSKVLKNPKDALLKGICHRGVRNLAPENNIDAFKLAKLYGFSYIETDVQFTSDNIPVMFHDDYINDKSSYSGTNKRISELTYAELLNYDFGSWFDISFSGLKILKFDDFLTLMKQLDLIAFVELKTPNTLTNEQAQILYNMTIQHNMKYNIFWLGYDILGLVHLREIDNDMNFAPAVLRSTIINDGLSGFEQTFPNPHDLVIFTNYANLDDETNAIFIRDNKKCGVWAVDNDSNITNLINVSKYVCEYFQSDGINVIDSLLK